MGYVAIPKDGDDITGLVSVQRSASQLQPATPAPARGLESHQSTNH
jgi:hypothetical protein